MLYEIMNYYFDEVLMLMAAITIMAIVFTVLYILVKRYARPKQQQGPTIASSAQPTQEQAVQPQSKREVVPERDTQAPESRGAEPEPEPQVTEFKPEQTAPRLSVDPEALEQAKAFKELLDEGVITQEDYDAKRKELLGI